MTDYVPHPRFGAKPRYTGLDPDPDATDVHLHYNTNFFTDAQRADMMRYCGYVPEPRSDSRHIPGTAVVADPTKQVPATIPVTHYYDIERRCRDCGRLFLFFAAEQQYWYEDLGFPLDADCVRCVPCRKRTQQLQRIRRRYEALVVQPGRTGEEEVELAICRLDLVEDGVFPLRQLEAVRGFLNRNPADASADDVRDRLERLERGC